jgi:quinoprotein glucose dehydrogenase
MPRQTSSTGGRSALKAGAGFAALLVAGAAATALSAQSTPAAGAGAGQGLPPGPGRDLVAANCSTCHAIGLAVAKRQTAEEWRDVLQRMVEFGAALSQQDLAAIHGYLSANFAPTAVAVVAPPPPQSSAPPAQRFPRPAGPSQWPAYGGGGSNLNYSELTQITPRNVARLKPAWTYRYGAGRSSNGDEGIDYRFEVTPLLIGGVMYLSTPARPSAPDLKASITALKPETGELLWKYESPLNIHGRGIAYWPGDANTAPRIVFGTDQGHIMAVDVTTGQPARGFGRNGSVDAYIGVASEIVGESRRASYTIPNPVTIYKDIIITGARPGEVGPPGPRGDIRGWDVRTGRLLWTFHTVPQPGEPGHETYKGDEWRDLTGANVWSTMALDEANGLVFAPLGDLNADVAGPHLYAASLVALDAKTGKLRWYQQLVHRDMWDFDSPTPPVLFDYPGPDGRTTPAVVVTGKQGLVYMFNRLTGETLNGLAERPTPGPAPGQAGELPPTQPIPEAPGPIIRTQMTRDEIPDLAPGMKAACQKYWDENEIVSVPLFAPRQSPLHATLSYPSGTGGPNWGGGSYNPDLGLYIVNLKNTPNLRPKVAPEAGIGGMNRTERPGPGPNAPPRAPRAQRPAPPFTFTVREGLNLSCAATPWGELVAVDVKQKKIAWRVPLGVTDGLGARGLKTGAPNLGGNISTKSGLVFIGATNDRRFRAFDAKTGKTLWETQLEASAHSTPVTYMGADGKQYVVVAAAGGTSVGGPEMSDTLVAYALP